MQLKDQVALISGASCGLGFEIAKQFVREGAHLMICARNSNELFAAQKKLQQIAPAQKILAAVTDVSSAAGVASLVKITLQEFKQINILVANAGIYGAKGLLEESDWEEWSKTIDINLKGTVLQCKHVLPHFKQQNSGKIIILSGGGATKPMPYLSAYAASKAGVVRFAESLSEEVKPFNIQVNAVAPGSLNTRLLDEVLEAGEAKVGKKLYQEMLKQKEVGGHPLEKAAYLCTYLASQASNAITGKLISAIWDPWQDFSTHTADLSQLDIYTLRRIVPKDRGKEWGDVS